MTKRKNMVYKILFIIFCTCVTIYSQSVETYLIFQSSVTKLQKTVLKNLGSRDIQGAKGQPFRITSIIEPSTKYFLLSIVPQNAIERNYINNVLSNGRMLLISTCNVESVSSRYGTRNEFREWKVRNLPKDFYNIKTSSKVE